MGAWGPTRFVGFGNFVRIANDSRFWLALSKSAIYMGSSTLISFTIGLSVALSLNNIKKVAGIFRSITLLPWTIPLIVSAFIWMWLLNDQAGLINDIGLRLGIISNPIPWLGQSNSALISVITADIWIRIPVMMIVLLAALQTVPTDLVEAATVDGAGVVQKFWHVTLPFLKPSMFFVLLINSIFAFRTYAIGATMTEGGPGDATYLLVIYIYQAITRFFKFGYAAALSMAMVFCIILIVAFWTICFRSTLKRE
jgi:multiple sugar transport system permease protein